MIATDAIRLMNETSATYVPTVWWLEIANGLLVAERRKRISQADAAEAFAISLNLPVTTDTETGLRAGKESASLARQYDLTIYDAAYLELAIRQSAGLATVDRALARAAKAAGITLLL